MDDLATIILNNGEFLGIKIIDSKQFLQLIVSFIFNTAVVLTIIRFLYYPFARRKEYYFAFLLVGIIVFLVTYSLVQIGEAFSLGAGIGLFALFGILRFRTSQIAIKEMTYLLVVIGVSVINALFSDTSYANLLFVNIAVIFATWTGERIWITMNENRKTLIYEKIDLIKPEKRDEMIADLKQRTGLDITRVQIGRIDFLRDTVRIRIFYKPAGNGRSLDEDDNCIIDNDTI